MIYAIESNEFATYLELLKHNKITNQEFYLLLHTNNDSARQALKKYLLEYKGPKRLELLSLIDIYRNEQPENYYSNVIDIIINSLLSVDKLIMLLQRKLPSNKLSILASILSHDFIWQNPAAVDLLCTSSIADLVNIAHYVEQPFFYKPENYFIFYELVKSPLKAKEIIYNFALIPEIRQTSSLSRLITWLNDSNAVEDMKQSQPHYKWLLLSQNGILKYFASDLDALKPEYKDSNNYQLFCRLNAIYEVVSSLEKTFQINEDIIFLFQKMPLNLFPLYQRFCQLPLASRPEIFRHFIKIEDIQLVKALVELTKYPEIYQIPGVEEKILAASNAKTAYETFRTIAIAHHQPIYENSEFGYENRTYIPDIIVKYLNDNDALPTSEILKLVPALTSDCGLSNWQKEQKL